LSILFAASTWAQSKCPALPEGSVCDHFHYHVMIWDPSERTYSEVSDTHQFTTVETCEKAKAERAKESQSIADFMKANVDSSFQGNRFGDCHCDRTSDPSSGVFLDPAARIAQLRVEQDAAWTIRERLLSNGSPQAPGYIRLLFGREIRGDRYLRETVPARVPNKVARPPAATLLDTKIGATAEAVPIAANVAFVDIPAPVAAGGSSVASTPAPTQAPMVITTPTETEGVRSFFLTEVARADAILASSEKIVDADVKSAVRQELMRRRHVLDNLRTITRLSASDGLMVRRLTAATDDAAKIAVIRGLFGSDVSGAWAPSDAKLVASTRSISTDVKPPVVFDSTADVSVRRAALFALLGQDRQLPSTEAVSFTKVVEELLNK
jgi:hypothetical protein